MEIKKLLKNRERSKHCVQPEGKDSTTLNGKALIDITYKIKEQAKYKSEITQINEATRELEIAVCKAIFNIIKDEVGTISECDIAYPLIPISIHVTVDEVYFRLHGQAYGKKRIEYLQALIKYAPKLCQRLEKDIRHSKDKLARDKKVFQTLLDILTPLAVEGKLLQR